MKFNMTKDELAIYLKQQGITVQKSHHHEDYILTSFSLLYPQRSKLGRLCKYYNMSRSALIRVMIENCLDVKDLE